MEIRSVLYYLWLLAGVVASAVVGYFIAIKKGLPKRASLIFVFGALATGIMGALLMGYIQSAVMYIAGFGWSVNNLRIFGGLFFTPLFILFPVKYLGADYDKVADVLCPGTYLLLGCAKLGCASYGCCYGIPFPFGVHSDILGTVVFPVQLAESILCFLLFAVMLFVVFRKKHRQGSAYPVSLILYGIMRFIAEFFRYYPEKEKTFFFGMNFWQLFSLIAVAVGILWLIRRFCFRRQIKI